MPHVQIARGERARGLDVDTGLPLRRTRGLVVAPLLPNGLAVGLDPPGVVTRLLLAHLAFKANLALPRRQSRLLGTGGGHLGTDGVGTRHTLAGSVLRDPAVRPHPGTWPRLREGGPP